MLLLFQPNLSNKPAGLETPSIGEEEYFYPRRAFAALGVALTVVTSFNPAPRQIAQEVDKTFVARRAFAPVPPVVAGAGRAFANQRQVAQEEETYTLPRRAFAPVAAAPLTPVINPVRQFWTYEGGGGGGSSSAAEVLLQEIVTSGSQNSVTFNPPASGYRDLHIRAVGRINGAAYGPVQIQCQLNGDTSANYNWLQGGFNAAGVAIPNSGLGVNAATIGYLVDGLYPGNQQGQFDLEIPYYLGTVFDKSMSTICNIMPSLTTLSVMYTINLAGVWSNTSAITSIKLFPFFSLSFTNGTIISLYGRL